MVKFFVAAVAAYVVFTIYAVVDCSLFDRARIRAIGKGWWLVVIILVPVIGGVLWFVIGRGRVGKAAQQRRGGPIAPDDDPDFLRRLDRDAEQDERIRRLEQELAELDGDEPLDGPDRHDHHDTGADPSRRRTDPGTDGAAGETGPTGRPNA